LPSSIVARVTGKLSGVGEGGSDEGAGVSVEISVGVELGDGDWLALEIGVPAA
jgi:hypothetical protein